MRLAAAALFLAVRAAAAAPAVPPGGQGPAGAIAISPPAARPVPPDARARATRAGFVLELHGDFGFSRLLEVRYTDGHTTRLDLNDGLTVAVGGSFLPLLGGRLATRATVGVKLDLLRASNGSARFTAVPVELMEAAYVGPFRLGAGASVLLWPRLAADGFLQNAAFRFDPAPGAVLEAEWMISAARRTGVGLRAGWYRYAWNGVVRGAPTVGLVMRTDLDLGGGR